MTAKNCISTVLILPILLSFTGCASHQPAGATNNTPVQNPPDTISIQPHLEAHKIEAGDLLEISVYENPDLTTEVRIPNDGYIPFPLLGNIPVTGMTVLELDSMITRDLEERYIYNPLVTVVVKEYKHRNIYVTGEVKKPGGYPYETGLTVRKAISLAGGFTEKAAKGKITVTRIINGYERSFPIELDDEIQEEDIITIPRSFF
jgi:protein involved in polysaccharide export with SLBB domain